MTLYFASQNPNKVAEIQAMLNGEAVIKSIGELGITEEIPEPGHTIEENAILKAEYVWNQYKVPVFADDTGLEVEALNGQPGVFSARYAGPEKDSKANIRLLIDNLSPFPDIDQRKAAFKTVICFIDSHGSRHLFTGRAQGHIIDELRGKEGFGYDPVFIPEGYDQTFAEMPASQKNSISHRFFAFSQLIQFIKTAASYGQ